MNLYTKNAVNFISIIVTISIFFILNQIDFPKINLTGFKSISVDINTNNVSSELPNAYIIGVWSNIGSGYYASTAAAKQNIINGSNTITLDVTSLNGEYFLGFGIRKDEVPSVYTITRVQLS